MEGEQIKVLQQCKEYDVTMPFSNFYRRSPGNNPGRKYQCCNHKSVKIFMARDENSPMLTFTWNLEKSTEYLIKVANLQNIPNKDSS